MVRGRAGQPLTLTRLSKDVWGEVCKLDESKIVSEFQNVGKKYSILRALKKTNEASDTEDTEMTRTFLILNWKINQFLGLVHLL